MGEKKDRSHCTSMCIINTLLIAPDNANEDESSISGSRPYSRSSNSSRSKAISDAVIERKVKAETARGRLHYVEKAERLKKEQYEFELSAKKRRSEMESNLNILKCKQEIVESEAELRAIQQDTFHLKPSAPEFVPQTTANFANYMVKKDLLLSRFYTLKKTNDRKELDLLLKNLAPESGRQANSIRNTNPHDVHGALEKIWEQLDLHFGAPEKVADS
ncbi:hypothetical protein DPMN_058515 [Dreissena polymorpha]|uniref:Uncharacterized protein n=1 Tax=Dreissena polymorpha TaxID=45954 RepID=A0A9D4HDS7_DREPO|nr:hypothetical protein DPMN_058515 [Dreissena polymorpha]